jgi:hypothetical protein
MSALTTHTFGNHRKEETKNKQIKETSTSDRKLRKAKNKIT